MSLSVLYRSSLISLFFLADVFSAEKIEDVFESYIPQVVKVIGHASRYAPTNERGDWTGTGFVFNAQKGWVLTNHHVAPTTTCASYDIELMDGTCLEDCCILASSGGEQFGDWTLLGIPELAGLFNQLPIDPQYHVKMHDEVRFMGNSSGSFSIETGLVNAPYHYWNAFGKKGIQSFRVHINHKGGASGSPVFNDQENVIGILFAGDDEHAMILPIWYVYTALQTWEQNQPIVTYTLGVSFTSANVITIGHLHHISQKDFESYLGERDEKRNLLLITPSTGQKDANSLQLNDVLLTINDRKIGANSIIVTEELMKDESVELTVLRSGQLKSLTVMPQKVETSFIKFFWGYGFSVRSASSVFKNVVDIPNDAPLFSIQGEQFYLINSIASPVTPRVPVFTFDEFVQVFYDIIVTKKKHQITLDIQEAYLPENRKLKTFSFSGEWTLEFFVHRFDGQDHRWKTYDYGFYVTHMIHKNNDILD